MALDTPTPTASERAKQLVKDAIVVDALNCLALFRPAGWGEIQSDAGLVFDYMDRARASGITSMGVTVGFDPHRSSQTLERISYWLDAISRHPDKYLVARTSSDIRLAHETNRLAIYFTNQGSVCFDENPELVGVFRQMGVGYCLLAYNNRYRVGDGAYEADDAGLTAWGRDIVAAMNKYGMPVDVSHTGIRAVKEALEYNKVNAPDRPPIYSHTGLKRHVDHTRAATDENGKAVAELGGVMNINLCNPVITENPTTEILPSDCAAAIDTAIKYLGVDHVGIATDDFEDMEPFVAFAAHPKAADKYPDGGRSIKDVLDGKNRFAELAKTLPAIVDCLYEMDYSDEDITKIVGGNMMRVFEQTWDKGITPN